MPTQGPVPSAVGGSTRSATLRERVTPRTQRSDVRIATVTAQSASRMAMWLTPQRERVLYYAIIIAAFVLRIWDVGHRAFHHDESLHGVYSWYITNGTGYYYDPMMHGPLQFHLYALMMGILGSSPTTGRLTSVLCGTAIVAIPFLLRRQLGRYVALVLTVLLCVSPFELYFSRFMREDIPFALWTALAVVGLARYLEHGRHHYRWLYLLFGALALAYATFEAAFFDIGILGGFAGLLLAIELLSPRTPRVLIPALRATPWQAWLLSALLIVGFLFLLYLPIGHPWTWGFIPGANPTSSYHTDVFTGGLSYWQSQQGVARGSQPWTYYFMLLPLYDQIGVVFGLLGVFICLRRGTVFYAFIAWWVVTSIGVYTYAGEKMPWLSVHMDIPLLFSAAVAIVHLLAGRQRTARWFLVAGAVAVLSLTTLRGSQALAYVNGDDPTEMAVYVQTSQDVPRVASWVQDLSKITGQGYNMHVSFDGLDAYSWPFIWYERFYHNIDNGWQGTPSSFSAAGTTTVALTVSTSNFSQVLPYLRNQFVGTRLIFNWWFPEDYKASPGQSELGHLWNLATTTPFLSNLGQWWLTRQPFNSVDFANNDPAHILNARVMWFLVRKQYASQLEAMDPTLHLSALPAQVAPTSPEIIPTALQYTPQVAAPIGSGFGSPEAVATDAQGDIYVTDPTLHKVSKFSPGGVLLTSWGGAGSAPGLFNVNQSPNGIAVDSQGNVYVADTWNQRIEKFSSTGRYLLSWGSTPEGNVSTASGSFYGPRQVAVGPGDLIYVADTGNKRIEVFTSTGTFVRIIGSAGTGLGQFQEPSGVTVDAQGDVYVADYWNQRIQKFSSTGRYLTQWPMLGWQSGSYVEPSLGVDARGHVYAADPLAGHVLIYSGAGKLLASLGTFGSGPGQYTQPVGVAVDPFGHVIVADTGTTRVQSLTLPTGLTLP